MAKVIVKFRGCKLLKWNLSDGVLVRSGWLEWQKWHDKEYKTKGRSKIKTANIQKIPRISPCDGDCCEDCRWTVQCDEVAGMELDKADVELDKVDLELECIKAVALINDKDE